MFTSPVRDVVKSGALTQNPQPSHFQPAPRARQTQRKCHRPARLAESEEEELAESPEFHCYADAQEEIAASSWLLAADDA